MVDATISVVDATIAAAAGGFMGAFGFWLVTKVEEWWRKPIICIEYGPDYPFRSEATTSAREREDFIRVRIKNGGGSTAKRCKCFVRHISLNSAGRITRLPSDELMLTTWVPREARTAIMNIPAGLDFLADLAHTEKTGQGYKVSPIFRVQVRNAPEIFDHVGDFELEVVVIGENIATARRTIKFRFADHRSPALTPLL